MPSASRVAVVGPIDDRGRFGEGAPHTRRRGESVCIPPADRKRSPGTDGRDGRWRWDAWLGQRVTRTPLPLPRELRWFLQRPSQPPIGRCRHAICKKSRPPVAAPRGQQQPASGSNDCTPLAGQANNRRAAPARSVARTQGTLCEAAERAVCAAGTGVSPRPCRGCSVAGRRALVRRIRLAARPSGRSRS